MEAQRRIRTANPSSGSRTQTQSQDSAEPADRVVGTLRLRGIPVQPRRRIRWAEDVVDNEGMGKKSSKVCCIYHKPRPIGESSSDESSSSSSSDSDSDSAPESGSSSDPKRSRAAHGHGHKHGCNHGERDDVNAAGGGADGANRPKKEKKSRGGNAYERKPKARSRRGGGGGTTTTELVNN